MNSKLVRVISKAIVRNLSTTIPNFKQFKVAIIGGAGDTGQHVSLLLKSNPLIYKLCLYDIADFVTGVAVDLSHVPTSTISKGYGKKRLVESLECCDIVVITPGGKRKANMKREDHWKLSASIVAETARIAAKVCPECFVAIISNPVNGLVPLVAEIFKQECAYNPNHIFGLTTIDTHRTKSLVGEILGIDPACVTVPVIGGHSIPSIIPVFSQCKPPLFMTEAEIKPLYQKIQLAAEAVVRMKLKVPTLSMAYCTASFITSLLRGLNCEPNIKELAFVQCDALGTKYCASEFMLSGDGISCFLPQPKLNEYEKQLLNMGIPDIKKHVKRGEEYAAKINPYKKEKK